MVGIATPSLIDDDTVRPNKTPRSGKPKDNTKRSQANKAPALL